MDEVVATSDNQCPTAITYIGFFASLFFASLIINILLVSMLVVVMCRSRRRDYTETYIEKRSRNSYIEDDGNTMWSEEAPEYSQKDNEFQNIKLEDITRSKPPPESDASESEIEVNNQCYESTDLGKKTVRFTFV